MVRRIIKFPAPSLRSACKPIDFATVDREALSEHIRDLKDTLAATRNGVALASNQVLAEGFRVFVVKPDLRVPRVATMAERSRDGKQSFPEVVINPKWEVYPPHEIDTVHPSDRPEHVGFVEGCLSVPELNMKLARQYWVDLEYSDEDGRRCVYITRGLGARIVQHECDHLDGKLIFDYADPRTKARVRAEAIRNRKAGR